MDFDSVMGWCTLGGVIGGAVGTLAGAAIGFHQESVSSEDAIAAAAEMAECTEDIDL